jgi:hypothetical protein
MSMNDDIRGALAGRRRARRALAARIFGEQPPREDPGNSIPDGVPEDKLEDVARLQELREHAERHDDAQRLADVDRRLKAIHPDLVPRVPPIDGGAGRGQSHELHRNPDDAMNAWIRGTVRHQREQHARYVREELLGG